MSERPPGHVVRRPTSDTGNRRRLVMTAAAAAVVVIVIVIGVAGIALVKDRADDETPSAVAATTVASPTVAGTTIVAPRSVSFPVSSANEISVTFTLPVNWAESYGWLAYTEDEKTVGDGAVVLFDGSITNIYTDGCRWTLLDPPVGPTVDDLVAAWADVPELAATPAVSITVDGYPGTQIELTLPDYTPSECREQLFGIYMRVGDRPPGQWAFDPGPNGHWQMWVVDVDGTRLLIAAATFPNTSPQDRAALEEVLSSIQIS